jgi:DNA-entry nuclease
VIAAAIVLTGCGSKVSTVSDTPGISSDIVSVEDIPDYSGEASVEVNDNEPYFTEEEKENTTSFESYSSLDSLGRCQTAYANIGHDLMPTEERGAIGNVKPSGWQIAKYDFVDGKYLYNRCHLIGYQLTAENANPENLITGTRYLNTEGMLPYENMVADYVEETDNHVLYRVTPVFTGDNLIADGVLMEGWSVEDEGEGISFNVFAYDVQPSVDIDYADGDSQKSKVDPAYTDSQESGEDSAEQKLYIINENTGKFHKADCPSVSAMKEKNRHKFTGDRQDLLRQGYEPCKNCNP